MYRAILLKESDDRELFCFLNETGKVNPSVLGYHYPCYRIMLQKIGVGNPLYLGLRNENGKLIALLPGFIKTQKEGSVYSALPFFGPNTGVLFDRSKHDAFELHLTMIEFLFGELRKYDMISFSIYSNFLENSDIDIFEQLITDKISIEKFTHYILLQDYKLSTSLEYDIRKAVKSGVTVRAVNSQKDIDDIYSIYRKNCEDYEIPQKPKECLVELISHSNTSNTTKTFIAEFNNMIIGSLTMIYGPSTASYYLPCSLQEYRTYQPTTLLIYQALKDSINKGIRYWNWESSPSKESGVYKFKKKWGSLEGSYKIFVKPYRDKKFFKQLGQEKIIQLFPYFFVYPFNLLKS